jgi:hypothetical protein
MKPLRKADQKVRRSKAIREVREDWPRACWISEQFRSTPGTSGPAPIGYGCVIAAQTGMSQPDAEKRVNDVIVEAKAAADRARKGAAKLAFWLEIEPDPLLEWCACRKVGSTGNGDDCPIGPAASSSSRSPLPQRNKPYRVRSRVVAFRYGIRG